MKSKMTILGVGPIFVSSSMLLTVIGILLKTYIKEFTIVTSPIVILITGGLFLFVGIYLWIQSVLISKISKNVTDKKLLTSGIYAWVRNPLYSAFMFFLTGILILAKNYLLLFIPFMIWLLLTITVRKEEEILTKEFGDEYLDYKRKVNRCIPWFPKK